MRHRFWLAGCVLLATAAARGAGFDPKVVAGNAQWYVHIDADAAHASPVAQKIHEQMLQNDRVQKRLQELKDKFHFDPSHDLHSVTMYGKLQHPHHGVTVIRADFDRSTVAGQLKEKFDFKSTTHGDHEVYTWTGPGGGHGRHSGGHRNHDAGDRNRHGHDRENARKDDARKEQARQDKPDDARAERSGDKSARGGHTIAISLVKDGLAVMAHSTETVEAALDVIDGKSDALSPLAADSVAGAMLQAKVAGLADARFPFKSPVLAQCERLSMSVSDLGGQWSASAQLGTRSEESAGQIEAILEGFRALAQLRHGSQAEVKAALDDLNVDSSGSTVSIRWELSDEDALALRDKVHQLHKQARERNAEQGHHRGSRRDQDRKPADGSKDGNSKDGESKAESKPASTDKPDSSK